MARHRQVHEVGIPEVDLRDTACSFHHNGIIAGSQTIESLTHLTPEINIRTPTTPVVIGTLTANGFAVEHHLRGVVTLRLQQQGVHIRMTGDACCLCLYGLRTSNLQSLRCGVGVECHILCLEGCRLIAILTEDATEGCSDDALAYIAACTCEHQRV